MIAPRRLAPLPLLLAGLAVLTLVIALTVHAQSQEVTPNRDATGTNPPAKPTNLQASAEHDSVTLTWTASTDQTVTHYAILRRNPDVDASQVFHVIESNAGPGTSHTDGSVSASTTYIYRVKSVSPTGVSQWSGYVKAETPAAPTPTPTPTLTPTPEPEPESTADDQAPTNLAAALAEGGGVTLTWTAPSDDAEGVTGYEVLRAVGQGDSTILVADTGSTTTTYTDATATDAGETYAYQVKAIRGDDRSQASGQAQVQVPHDPVDLAPSNLTAALADGGGVNLSWSAPAEDADSVTGYEILRAVGEGDMATLAADTGNTATAYTDTTATEAGETYAYKVKAIRGEDRSQASGQARVQVPHDPEDLRPTGLTVSLVGNKVTLSWAAPAEDAESVDGYEILRRRPMEGESALATLVADTESTATTYTDATANEAGVRYVYRVKALRGDDVSLWSNFDKIELPADYVPDPTPTPEPESTPDDQAPTGLSAALADGGGVTLTWTAPSDDADSVTGYEILRAVGEGEMATLVDDTGSTDTTYTDATATEAGETYVYQVKAIRGEDRSQASGQAQVQLPHDPADLAPTGLTAVILIASVVGEEGSTISVRLSWTAPAEDADTITGYEILRAVGDGEIATLKADTGSTSTFYNDATATQPGTSYTYEVKAIRGEDRSQASGQARVQLPHDAVDLAPSDLTAEAVDGGGVSLSWTAPAEDAASVTGYEVLRAVGEGEMATLAADTASTTTTYTDATATGEGETYAYQVKAIRGQARSQASNRVSLIPVEPPATPENLKPTNLTFEIREDGVTLAWDAPAADTDSVTGYRVVRRRPNQGENEWLVWKWDTGSTETTYRDGYAQTHGEFYMYRVRALRGDDYSKMSNRVDVRRPEATPQTAEWAPSNLQAQMYFEVALGEEGVTTQVKLTWDAPAEGVEWVRGYQVQRATCDDDFITLVADTGSTATAYADAGVEEGESYTYRVRARRPQGLSLTSNTWTLLLPGGNGESDCAVPVEALPSQVQDPQTGLTPAMLLNTLLGYDEAEGTGTLAPNELIFGEGATVRVTSVTSWPGVSGLVLYLTAGTSVLDAALADRDFILEADETVLVVGTTDFSFDDATLSHSDTTGDNEEYTGVVIVTWTEGEPGLVAGETVDFRLVKRNRPDEPQFTQHNTVLVKNTGQNPNTIGDVLDTTRIKIAQQFTTGAEANGYTLSSIGIRFFGISQTSTAGSHLVATLNAVASNGNPGDSLCTLSDPSSFTSSGVQTFDAHVGCPTLTPTTTYFVVIERVQDNGQDIHVSHTFSNNEDTGGAAGWSIANGRHHVGSSRTWISQSTDPYQIEVRGAVRTTFDPSTQEFNTLSAAGNTNPLGLWSDGTTMWVSHNPEQYLGDTSSPKLFAYNMSTKARDSAKDFNTLDAAGNDSPRGIWSDGSTMWVVDVTDEKIYAYDMDTKARVSSKDFNNLYRIREDVDEEDARPFGIWSDGEIMWVVDANDYAIYAYDMDTKKRVPEEGFEGLEAASNIQTSGLWADGSTMFVANAFNPNRIYAYWRSNKAPNPDRYITLKAENDGARGIWSDGTTMWVSDTDDDKIYAYALPDAGPPPDTLSVEHVTDTMALVKVDIGELVRAYGSSEPAVSVSVLGTLSSATMYVHPEGDYARFLLLGLRPETQYTVIASYGVTTKYDLGDAGREIFRTDYARLAGMKTSGLTHTEATVTVSLNGEVLDRGCCFRFYPHSNKDQAERDYTFYLRHKPSDEDDWSDPPVRLTFSDFAADVRLTGLDPDTAYDVEVAETADFMPPQGSAGSYEGTMTVATDQASGIGFDQLGFGGVVDPYGSLSPTTFKLGGVDHSIIELRVAIPSFFFPSTEFGKLFLTFDKALPDGIEFTLTVGTTTFNSSDANLYEQTYDWAGGPSWSVDDSVTVELDFTGVAAFREGTTLEGAFTTPPLPTPFTFETEMTVGTDVNTAGYDSTQGTLSQNTFEVGGVEYTVNGVIYKSSGTLTGFQFTVQPAIPFDFNLTLGGTQLKSGSATTNNLIAGGTLYRWAGTTDPNWANGATVGVELEVFELIDICDRSPAVAHAIREATPSFDFCHMTSPIDLANLTELDLPGGRGTGLKAGDFEGLSGLNRLDLSHYILSLQQLPVGVFNGLDSLTHLDLSHTDLLKLDLGVFEGLDNLIELDLSDTSLQRSSVPVGVFDDVPNLEVLRLTNESSIGGYRRSFSNLNDDFFRGLSDLRELDVGDSTPLRDSPRSLLPLTSLTTLNGQAYTRPADPPANFQYASGRIDHELGFSKTCYAVTLRWDTPTGVSGITGYRILRNLGAESLSRYAKQIAMTGASARTFVDGRNADVCFGGVGSGPNVSYFVSAITADGDSFPARVRVDQTAKAFPTTQVPNTPTLRGSLYDLSVAKSPNGYKVRLQWNDLHHNITGYEISFRGSSSAAWQTIVVNAGNVLEYDLESVPVPPSSVPRTAENMFLYNAFRDQGDSIGFTDGREFRIRAINAAGHSGWSNVVRPFR